MMLRILVKQQTKLSVTKENEENKRAAAESEYDSKLKASSFDEALMAANEREAKREKTST